MLLLLFAAPSAWRCCTRLTIALAVFLYLAGRLATDAQTSGPDTVRNGSAIDGYSRLGSILIDPFEDMFGHFITYSGENNMRFCPFFAVHPDFSYLPFVDWISNHVPMLLTPHYSFPGREKSEFIEVMGVTVCSSTAYTEYEPLYLSPDYRLNSDNTVGVYWMAFTNFPYNFTHTALEYSQYGCRDSDINTVGVVNLLTVLQDYKHEELYELAWLEAEKESSHRSVCVYNPSQVLLDPSEQWAPIVQHFTAPLYASSEVSIGRMSIPETATAGICSVVKFDPVLDGVPLVFATAEYVKSSVSIRLYVWVEFASAEAAEVEQ